MDAFVAYSLPIQGLKTGVHQYKFEIDSAFFASFEASPVEDGKVLFDLTLDKRHDMMLLDFELSGHVKAICDRCTATIDLPISDERQLIVKFGEAEAEVDDEVVFIHREASEFNVAKCLYEFVVLSLPITNTYDCENDPEPPCNFEVLDHLKANEIAEDEPPVWESLRNLKSDN